MSGRALIPRVTLAVLLVAASIWVLMRKEGLDLSALEAQLRSLGACAPIAFAAALALATVLFFPARSSAWPEVPPAGQAWL